MNRESGSSAVAKAMADEGQWQLVYSAWFIVQPELRRKVNDE